MKRLKFSEALVPLVLNGSKNTTWRIDDDKNIVEGDELSLCSVNGEEFEKAVVISMKVKTFAELDSDDVEGHESFSSDDEMYGTYSQYYHRDVTPETIVKIIKFKIKK